jgi:hypothetical protein
MHQTGRWGPAKLAARTQAVVALAVSRAALVPVEGVLGFSVLGVSVLGVSGVGVSAINTLAGQERPHKRGGSRPQQTSRQVTMRGSHSVHRQGARRLTIAAITVAVAVDPVEKVGGVCAARSVAVESQAALGHVLRQEVGA